jgi:hypothetical protein
VRPAWLRGGQDPAALRRVAVEDLRALVQSTATACSSRSPRTATSRSSR